MFKWKYSQLAIIKIVWDNVGCGNVLQASQRKGRQLDKHNTVEIRQWFPQFSFSFIDNNTSINNIHASAFQLTEIKRPHVKSATAQICQYLMKCWSKTGKTLIWKESTMHFYHPKPTSQTPTLLRTNTAQQCICPFCVFVAWVGHFIHFSSNITQREEKNEAVSETADAWEADRTFIVVK